MNSVMQLRASGESTFMPFRYHDENGKLLFEHNRYVPPDGKRVVYYRWNPVAYWNNSRPRRKDWVNGKPEKRKGYPFDADDYLYRLPEVLRGIAAGEAVHWTEGERDADALVRLGLVATSHHGGAGAVFIEQAEWLKHAPAIVLYLDRDPPGANCGLTRWRCLVEDVGVDPARITVLYTAKRGCNDVRDHLALGYPLADLRRMSIAGLRKEAAKYNRDSAAKHGYPFVVSPKKGRA